MCVCVHCALVCILARHHKRDASRMHFETATGIVVLLLLPSMASSLGPLLATVLLYTYTTSVMQLQPPSQTPMGFLEYFQESPEVDRRHSDS